MTTIPSMPGDVDGTEAGERIGLDFIDAEGDRVLNDATMPDRVFGNGGNDTIQLYSGDDTAYGGLGNDSIYGHRGNNLLYGGEDDDLIFSGRDDSELYGEAGDDTLVAQINKGGDHLLSGGAGTDAFKVLFPSDSDGPASHTTIADFDPETETVEVDGQLIDFTALPSGFSLGADGDGNAVLSFNEDDTITFQGVGPEALLDGSPTPGQVDGTEGDDRINLNFVDAQGDFVTDDREIGDLVDAGGGNDIVQLYAGDDTAYGGEGDDSIYGIKGENELYGGAGEDFLHSGRNSSTLDGGEDDDVLFAQLSKGGDHQLTGGEGADTFNLAAASENATSTIEITDFTPLDVLEIDGVAIDFNDLPEGVTLDEDADGNAVLAFSDDETVTLTGVAVERLLTEEPPVLPLADGGEIPILPPEDPPEETGAEDDDEVDVI